MNPPRFFAACLVVVLLWFGAAESARSADRIALVIGNDEYPDGSSFPVLKNCVNDAKLVSKTLIGVGFEVIEIYNADLSTMDDALTRFEGKITKGGTALIYFAGHGIEFEKKNYLMASNAMLQARSRLTREAMEAEVFATAMLLAGAKSSFLLLDCCREKPPAAEWAGRGRKESGLAEISVDGDLVISMAAAPGKQALEPAEAGRNSPYATALAKWIPSGLKHRDVFAEVRKEVFTTTEGQQRPWDAGSFLDDFYFAAPRNLPGNVPMVPVPVVPEKHPLLSATKDSPWVNQLGMEFVPLPGHPGVFMCRTETRVRDFEAFVNATGYNATEGALTLESGGFKPAGGSWRAPRFPSTCTQTADHPVTCMSWADACAFNDWLSRTGSGLTYRLPTDAEWSAAVGVGKYPWGGGYPPPKNAGNYAGSEAKIGAYDYVMIEGYDDGAPRTSPVGSYGANRFGFFDLGGNVYEWCVDKYRASMNDADVLKEDSYLKIETLDYGIPCRVLRGGSWTTGGSEIGLRSSYRIRDSPTSSWASRGFRCVALAMNQSATTQGGSGVSGVEAGKWTMDYEAALKLAAAKKLPIILNFTRSDWSDLCKLMGKNVFSREAWTKYAADKMVLVTVDFPQDPLKVPEGYQIRNEALQKNFGIHEFPTYIVLDSDGSSILGQLGAGKEKTPESFIQEFKDTTRFSAANVELYSSKHPDKAADLKASLEAFRKVQSDLNAWIETGPVQNDENDKKFAGFRKEIVAALEKLDTFK